MRPNLIIVLLLFAGCSEVATNDGAHFIIEKGKTITIELESNLTIPYKWKIISKNPLLELTDESYNADNTNRVGSGGMSKWKFKALKKGRDTLRFMHAHTQVEKADSNAVIKTFTVEIK